MASSLPSARATSVGWWPKRLVIGTAVFLGILVALALTVRVLLGGDRIKAAVESQASAALGHPVTIRAAVPRLLPRIGLELTGITIGAAREVTIEQARLDDRLPGAPWRPRRRRRGRRSSAAGSMCAGRSRSSARSCRFRSQRHGTGADRADDRVNRILCAATTSRSSPASRQLLVDLDSSLSGGDRFLVRRLHGRSEGSDLAISGSFRASHDAPERSRSRRRRSTSMG